MTDGQRLLAEYVKNGSEPAFRELVTRYIDLVYSVAVRLVDGDTHLAEDVAQTVFLDLARMSRTLSTEVMLGGWLHRHTCYVAATTMRGERRRHLRERQAVQMNAQSDHSEANLAQVAPILDEAINELGDDDRTAILLRFFEERDLRSIGRVLGSSEDAARMRVSRALEKLESLLKERGVAFSAAALGTCLATEAVAAAPAGLAAGVCSAVLASGLGTGVTVTAVKLVTMTKLKLLLIGAVAAAGVATPLVIQHQSQVKLHEENEALRQQVKLLDELSAENERLSNVVAQSKSSIGKAELQELLRLRSEVGLLRGQLKQLAILREENRRLQELQAKIAQASQAEQVDPATDPSKQRGMALLSDAKLLVLGLLMYANDNQDRFPATLDQTEPYLRNNQGGQGTTLSGTNQFEMVYQGSLHEIANPQSVIVIREKQPWQGMNGNWYKGYGFADGHSEVHRALDGSFDAWEKERMIPRLASGQ